MGFLDDFDINLDNYEDSGFDNPPDGTYSFVVKGSELKEGTSKDEDAVNIVVSFDLEDEEGETRSWNWWLRVPADPDRPTRWEEMSMARWKKWCLGAGFEPSEINKIGPEDIEGISGTVRLVTRKGKAKKGEEARDFQNPADWTFDGVEEEEKPAPAKASKPRAATKPKPAPEPEEDEEEEEAPARTASRGKAKANPFKKS